MDASPEPLKARFLARIDRPGGDDAEGSVDSDPDLGLDLWRTIVTDPWYEFHLSNYARAVVDRCRGRGLDVDEVKQQARLALQQKLAVNPTLNADRHRIDKTFDPWMRKIIYHTCCSAVGEMVDEIELICDEQLERGRPLRESEPTNKGAKAQRALLKLPASQRTALTLKADRKKIEEIAQLMQITQRQVKYLLHLARQQMKRLLSSEADAESDDTSY